MTGLSLRFIDTKNQLQLAEKLHESNKVQNNPGGWEGISLVNVVFDDIRLPATMRSPPCFSRQNARAL